MQVTEMVEFGLTKVQTDEGIFARIDYRGANPFGDFSWYRPTELGFEAVLDDVEDVLDDVEDVLEAAYQAAKAAKAATVKHEPSHDEGSQL